MSNNNYEYPYAQDANSAVTSDMGTPKSPKHSSLGYRILAAVFFLLAFGGLFLGMLGTKVAFFAPSSFITFDTLSGSLLGYMIDYFKNIGTVFSPILKSGNISSILIMFTNILLLILLAITVVTSFIICIVSLFSGKAARKHAVKSGVLVLLTYASFFLWGFYAVSVADSGLSAGISVTEMFDVPTGLIGGITLLILIVTTFAKCKFGVANVLLLLVSLALPILACYPGSHTAAILALDPLSNYKVHAFAKIAMLLFAVMTAINVFFSIVRLNAEKGYGGESLRFGLHFFTVILLIIAFIVEPLGLSRWGIFEGKQLLYTISIAVLLLLAFILSIVTMNITHKQAADKSAEQPAEQRFTGYYPPAEFTPAETYPQYAQPAYAEPEPVYAPVPEAEPYAAQEAPMSEFERRMAALARGESPEVMAEEAPQPVIIPQRAAPTPKPAPQQTCYFDMGGQYTYDPFINSLSAQEKNEFGDLFIACKQGKLENLPVYVIGGDNTEFFRKVFIYLGKFRNHISAELLDKLYIYVSKNN